MPDFLDLLANNAMRTIEEGYYGIAAKAAAPPTSLKEAILRCEKAPVISEVKFASPSSGTIRENCDLRRVVREMEEGGAVGVSILTEPKQFKGHIDFIAEIRDQIDIPVLMKDIILSPVQIDAASRTGANAVLLIQTLFDRGYGEKDIQGMIDYSHSKGLEVLLEVHAEGEFLSALRTDADMIGINNRDLKTLEVDLGVTERILTKYPPKRDVIVSESGINGPEDIRLLHGCGAKAFLVGTAIMEASNVMGKVKELVEAL